MSVETKSYTSPESISLQEVDAEYQELAENVLQTHPIELVPVSEKQCGILEEFLDYAKIQEDLCNPNQERSAICDYNKNLWKISIEKSLDGSNNKRTTFRVLKNNVEREKLNEYVFQVHRDSSGTMLMGWRINHYDYGWNQQLPSHEGRKIPLKVIFELINYR